MSINLIWDMDGTLIDSYDSIIDCICKTIDYHDIEYDKSLIRDIIQKESTSYFLKLISKKNMIPYEDLWNYYNSLAVDENMITLMPNVARVLEMLETRNVKNYIYTHRGSSAYSILKNLKIEKYFVEVVNSEKCFERKPSPEAINYLVNKYEMNRKETYYIGDRLLDQKCARNASIKSIFYNSYKDIDLDEKDYDYKIEDLLDLIEIGELYE